MHTETKEEGERELSMVPNIGLPPSAPTYKSTVSYLNNAVTSTVSVDLKEVALFSIDALDGTTNAFARASRETKEKVMKTIQPFVEPIYQKVCKRVKEWAKHVSPSEMDHFMFGFLLGVCLLLGVTTVMLLSKKRKRTRPLIESSSTLELTTSN